MSADTSLVAVGYLRRSTDRQDQSIGDQQKVIERYAQEHGIRLERFFVDDAISGCSAQGRPAFLKMVDHAQQEPCPFSRIVVYDVTRFGRMDNDEAGYYRHLLRMHGVEVVYANENFRGDSTDDLLRPVKQWQAREESKCLSRVTIRGLLSRIERGYWNGGVPPYGYDLCYERPQDEGGELLFVLRYQPDGTKLVLDEAGATVRTLARCDGMQVSKRDHSRLVQSALERVETVRRVFTLSAEDGLGHRAIANTLNQEGIPSPRGPGWASMYSGSWTAASIRSILINPTYVGDLVWNRRTESHFFKIANRQASERRQGLRALVEHNAEEDWIRIRDAHPAIVSRRLFQAAQRGRRADDGPGARRGASSGARSKFLLSGLGECARCGGQYQGCHRTKRERGSEIRVPYYGCGIYLRKGRKACRFGPVLQETLEQAVVETLVDYYRRYAGEAGRRKLYEAVRECAQAEAAALVKANRAIYRRDSEIDSGIARLLDAMSDSIRPLVEPRIESLREEQRSLEKKRRRLGDLEISPIDHCALVEECSTFLAGLEGALRSSSPGVPARVLHRCVRRVIVDQEAGTIRVWTRPIPFPSLGAMLCVRISRSL